MTKKKKSQGGKKSSGRASHTFNSSPQKMAKSAGKKISTKNKAPSSPGDLGFPITEHAFREAIEKSIRLGLVAFDYEGRQIYANPTFCRMVGWSQEELIGRKPPFPYWPQEDKRTLTDAFLEVFSRQETSHQHELRFQHRDGRRLDALVIFSELRDQGGKSFGWLASVGDITERKRQEEEIKRLNQELEQRVVERTAQLEEANQELKKEIVEPKRVDEVVRSHRQLLDTVVNHLPAAVNLIRGSDLRIQLVNPAYQAIGPGKEMVGKTLDELWPEAQRNFADLCRKVLATGEPYHAVDDMNMIRRYPGGPIEQAYFSWSFYRVRLPGDEGWAILNTSWETTERKRIEDEIRKLNEQISKKALDLELANKELDSFTSAVSHDLKNDLIVISAFTGKIIKRYMEKLDTKGQEYMRIINSSVEKLAALVGNLLDLSRLSKAKMKIETLNLSELVLSILEKYQEKDTERQVEVVVPKKVEAQGDRSLLTVVLENLLNNAWKYTKNLAAARIEFGVIQESEEPIFFVRDNGCGFPVPADPEQIFFPFTRFHKAEEYPGTGVGLATVKRIISRHGGKIWVESSVGIGTVFYFTLKKIME